MTYPPSHSPSGNPSETPDWESQGQPYDAAPGQPPTSAKLSGYAVASLIFGLTGCLSLFGIILGVSALRQIKRDGERGRGLAIAGIVLGAVFNGTAAILTLISFIVSS